MRLEFEDGGPPASALAGLGVAQPGEVAIDLALVDARPTDPVEGPPVLTIEPRAGGDPIPLSRALARLPAYALIARRFRKVGTGGAGSGERDGPGQRVGSDESSAADDPAQSSGADDPA